VTDVGHSKQINQNVINMSNPNVMASAGFDGSIRKWNLKNMLMESMYEHRTGN